jgi:hypothetical protein
MHNLFNSVNTTTRLSNLSSSPVDVIITDGSADDTITANTDLGFLNYRVQILYHSIDDPLINLMGKEKCHFI